MSNELDLDGEEHTRRRRLGTAGADEVAAVVAIAPMGLLQSSTD